MRKLWLAAALALAPFAMDAQTLTIINNTTCPVNYHVYADPSCTSGSFYNVNPVTIAAGTVDVLNTLPGSPMPAGFVWNAPPPGGSFFDIFKVLNSAGAFVGEPCTPWPLTDKFQCGAVIFVDWSTISPGNFQVNIHY